MNSDGSSSPSRIIKAAQVEDFTGRENVSVAA